MSNFKKILAGILAATAMVLPTSAAFIPGDIVTPNAGLSGMVCSGCRKATATHVCASMYVSESSGTYCSEHADENCRVYTLYARTYIGCSNCSYSDNSNTHACAVEHRANSGSIAMSTTCYIINGNSIS